MIVEHTPGLGASLRRLPHYQPFHDTPHHNYDQSFILYS